MSDEDARAAAAWVADWFGSLASPGRATAGAVGPVRYRGSPYWTAPTPGGRWDGYYGWFELGARDGSPHSLRVSSYLGDEDERCYLVFVLDDTPTPTFEFHLEANRVHAVPGGWLLTHLKWIGLGAGGGSIGQDRVMGTVRRNAPWLLGRGSVDLGVLYRDNADPIGGIAGVLHRVLDFALVRQELRDAHLDGRDDP